MKNINGIEVLERADIEILAPSFYAESPKSDVSDSYSFVSSRNVAAALWGMGWMPTRIKESRYRDQSNAGYAKHLVAFTHKDVQASSYRIELGMVNSHNRSSSLQFFSGIYVLLCSNGLKVKTADFGSRRVNHIGDIKMEVEYVVKQIAGNASSIAGRVSAMQSVSLSIDAQRQFAIDALALRYDAKEASSINPFALLQPRRMVEVDREHPSVENFRKAKPDVWTTFNVVQENLMKGGLRTYSSTSYRRSRTRAINSIDADLQLNGGLWELAEQYAKIVPTPQAQG